MKPYCFYIAVLFLLSLWIYPSCKKEISSDPEIENNASLLSPGSWKIASTPMKFPESALMNDTRYGMNRAKICWYNIDASVFYDRGTNRRPPNITAEDMSGDDCRVIYVNEIFPNYQTQNNQPLNLPALNIDFFPAERGPMNFDTDPTEYSAGMNTDGSLVNSATRWGGIMRKVETTTFQYNYLDFWMIDPFTTYPEAKGTLFINLGDISEDIFRDGKLAAENTLNTSYEETAWGRIRPLSGVNSFDVNDFESQDVGLDGLNSEDEQSYFSSYLEKVQQRCDAGAFAGIRSDPSADEYHYYLGTDYDNLYYKVRDRYRNYNGTEKNSFCQTSEIATRFPESEDLNLNGILDTTNQYQEYKIEIDPSQFVINQNYIIDIHQENDFLIKKENGKNADSKFYHFRIPIGKKISLSNPFSTSQNPRFIRIYLAGFNNPVNLRLFELELQE
jgi:cell surface protein SprA